MHSVEHTEAYPHDCTRALSRSCTLRLLPCVHKGMTARSAFSHQFSSLFVTTHHPPTFSPPFLPLLLRLHHSSLPSLLSLLLHLLEDLILSTSVETSLSSSSYTRQPTTQSLILSTKLRMPDGESIHHGNGYVQLTRWHAWSTVIVRQRSGYAFAAVTVVLVFAWVIFVLACCEFLCVPPRRPPS